MRPRIGASQPQIPSPPERMALPSDSTAITPTTEIAAYTTPTGHHPPSLSGRRRSSIPNIQSATTPNATNSPMIRATSSGPFPRMEKSTLSGFIRSDVALVRPNNRIPKTTPRHLPGPAEPVTHRQVHPGTDDP